MHSPTISTLLASAMLLLQMSIAVVPPSREGLQNIARGLDIDDSIPSNIVTAGVEKRIKFPGSGSDVLHAVECAAAIAEVVAEDSSLSSKLTKLGGAKKVADLLLSLGPKPTKDDILRIGGQELVDLLGLQPIKDNCLKS